MDEDLHQRINQLAEEEHALRSAHGDGSGMGEEDAARLRRVEESLDQAWDLLRQRDARRRNGMDPDEAQERDTGTVENYLN